MKGVNAMNLKNKLSLLVVLASMSANCFAANLAECPACPSATADHCPTIEDIKQDPSDKNTYYAKVNGEIWKGTVKGKRNGQVDEFRSASAIPSKGIAFDKPWKFYCSYSTVKHGILYLYYPKTIDAKNFFVQPGWSNVITCVSQNEMKNCLFNLPKS